MFRNSSYYNSEDDSEEERKRTGRYLAAGIVLFLVALGLYHALLYGSPRLSALLGAAFVMFLYLVWILYASQRKKKLMKLNEEKIQRDLEEILKPQIMETQQREKKREHRHHHRHHNNFHHHNNYVHSNMTFENELRNSEKPMFVRTYSVA